MNLIEAKKLIYPILKDMFKEDFNKVDIWDESCIKFERGWVINYSTKEFIEDQVYGLGLIGHKPFLIDVIDMKIYRLFLDIVQFTTYYESLSIYMYEKEICPDCEILPIIKKL